MGGSILFTQSETFDPAVYGLVTGKFINYIMIGGGGAGGSWHRYQYSTTSSTSTSTSYDWCTSGGSNGGTSSIGSYVSARGGTTATTGNRHYNNYMYGGCGAEGWIPGKVFKSYSAGTVASTQQATDTVNGNSNLRVYYDGGQKIVLTTYGENAAVTYPIANTKYNYASSSGGGVPNPYSSTQIQGTLYDGSDGLGYGGGGGGGSTQESTFGSDYYYAGNGGESGEFKQGSFKLTSTSPISITVGAAGVAHNAIPSQSNWDLYQLYNNMLMRGRNGTHGAVMLFWD